MPSKWTVEFTTLSITAHIWGSWASDKFGSTGARLSMIIHKNGAVFLAIVGADPSSVLLLNFRQFWLTSTYRCWTTTAVTYRAVKGGIYLVFSCASSLDGFKECCDRVLPSNLTPCPTPSIQNLYDLRAIPAPRFVGDFLLASSCTSTPPLESAEVDSEAGSEAVSKVGSGAGSQSPSELDSPALTLVDLEDFMSSLDLADMDELTSIMLEELAIDDEREWLELKV